ALHSDAARDPLAQGGADLADIPPDISGIATIGEREALQILLCSHHDDWDVQADTEVTVHISGLEPGRRYEVYGSAVDHDQANAHTAWVRMGRPQPPDDKQLGVLHEASRLRHTKLFERPVNDGCVSFPVILRAHGVYLLELVPLPG
ncbi:MAG: hypothetical protein H5T69_21185, partial [Chloroflexi bacterium]|nr:hypothetical protein [Chloroflexota bacterium]